MLHPSIYAGKNCLCMIGIEMKSHVVSDNNRNIVNPQYPKKYFWQGMTNSLGNLHLV